MEMERAYRYIEGVSKKKDIPNDWRKVVKNAVDGINRKTRKKFNFSVIHTEGNTLLYLGLPPEFT